MVKIKERIYNIIFETDTRVGKIFDIFLVVIILLNSILIVVESVENIRNTYETIMLILGWIFIIIFAIEYILRLIVVKKTVNYAFSFFGIIDFIAIFPAVLSIFFPHLRFLTVVRVFRLLRLFSIFKMGRYIDESTHLVKALKASGRKIIIFIFAILFIIIIMGSVMYVVEGPENGFTNILVSMYWAIVTVSTVGYGDISPQTGIGKLLSSFLMIISYGIIAVPTGIISYEFATTSRVVKSRCDDCDIDYYSNDDQFCSKCGKDLR